MASCIEIESLLQAYIDDELNTAVRVRADAHLAACADCRQCLHEARAAAVLLFETLREDRLQKDLAASVMAHLPEMEEGDSSGSPVRQPEDHEPGRAKWVLSAVPRLIPVFAPIILLVLAALLWTTWPATQLGGERSVGIITYCDGPVFSGHSSHAQQRNVRPRQTITDGNTFAAHTGGRLQLGLTGPVHIAVYENTFVEIKTSREINLHRGRIFLDIAREARHFLIDTPNGLIRVFGTSFHVDVRDASTEVTVINGEVLVENEHSFAWVQRGCQAEFQRDGAPVVYPNVDVEPYLTEARAVSPDTLAEYQFLKQMHLENGAGPQPVSEQVFVVDTRRRSVDALRLRWIPDPYSSGHRGYNLYVSDNAMKPLFKAVVPPSVFQDKHISTLRIPVPKDAPTHEVSVLHITVVPDTNTGLIETTFTEISAIGIQQ